MAASGAGKTCSRRTIQQDTGMTVSSPKRTDFTDLALRPPAPALTRAGLARTSSIRLSALRVRAAICGLRIARSDGPEARSTRGEGRVVDRCPSGDFLCPSTLGVAAQGRERACREARLSSKREERTEPVSERPAPVAAGTGGEAGEGVDGLTETGSCEPCRNWAKERTSGEADLRGRERTPVETGKRERTTVRGDEAVWKEREEVIS